MHGFFRRTERTVLTAHDRHAWEDRWARVLRDHGDREAQRPPNAQLIVEIGELRPGRAVDAGCGHGAEALWLAARGVARHGSRLLRDGSLSASTCTWQDPSKSWCSAWRPASLPVGRCSWSGIGR
jgi:hypothetical protein